MYRIKKIKFVCKDGSTEHIQKDIDVIDLDAYRKSLMSDKYASINFFYSKIDDNRTNREASQASESKNKRYPGREAECAADEE
jgi:hypothetical protein